MGLLSDFRKLVEGTFASAELERAELEQVRQQAQGASGDAAASIGPKVRRRYTFTGSVQGVGFRWTATNLASRVGATGWVKNEYDGSVTAEIQGVVEQVDAVIDGLDRYYNGRRFMGGFTISAVRDVPVIEGDLEFKPVY